MLYVYTVVNLVKKLTFVLGWLEVMATLPRVVRWSWTLP